MKVIFDIGANKGQNLNYFLDKADIVFAFEAEVQQRVDLVRHHLNPVFRTASVPIIF